MIAVRWSSLLLLLVCLVAFVSGQRSWALAGFAGAVFLVLAWSCGAGVVFTRGFWFDGEVEAEQARVDERVAESERSVR